MKSKIAYWYRHHIWSTEQVANAVKKGILDEEEYKEITGEEYVSVTEEVP